MRIACGVYLFILVAFTAITIVSGASRALTVMYLTFDAVHAALCVAVFSKFRQDGTEAARTRVCRAVLEITVLSFFLLEAVFPFPDQQSIYFPFPLILLVIIFPYTFERALGMILGYTLAFAALVCVFKTGTVRLNDIYVAAGTLISALTAYAITAALRHEASQTVERLRSLSMTDALTGLYNKRTFESLCKAIVEDANNRRGYALLFIDIDRFKQINDRFGHQMGDAVLRSVSTVMRESFYEKDYLCRFGGDEFVVFMVDVESEANVTEQIKLFQQKVRALSRVLKTDELSCSVGFAMKAPQRESYGDLLSRADASLYVVKKSAGQEISLAEQHFKQSAYRDLDARLSFGASAAEEPSVDPRSVLRRRVLVVDDNAVNRQVLRKILSASYEVLEAEDGQEALELLAHAYETVSAVLLDIIMPVMDGYEVLSRMRKDENLARIPVIVTTGVTEEDAEVKALSLGANDFVVKPYRPAIIMHRLQNTINLRESAAMVNAAERDALTGVYSREFFYKKAEALIHAAPAGRYDIVCCDIEHFKLINELFGKKTGDELLRYVANLLVHEGICGEGICGRIGSDRFASLILHRPAYREADFEAAAQAVNRFPVTVNISLRHGIYTAADDSVPVSTMCDRALTACDSIKGRYGVLFAYYDDAFRQRTLNEQFILDGMQAGLREGQFKVYYQPKYSLETGEIMGAEALVRWIHPEKGFMSPGEFIPLFERNGFITDLDVYVWETACADLREWMDAGKAIFPVSVNVSRMDIYNRDLPDILRGLLEKYALEPRYLHLEITETACTEDSGQLIEAVGSFRSLGFLIEMDDFGSGYSSLNMVSELPIDILKLDMRLIQESADDRKKSVLSAISYLAGQLHLPAMAEGVETAEQASMLKDMGCSYAQGFYFAKPMPKAEFEQLLKKAGQGLHDDANSI